MVTVGSITREKAVEQFSFLAEKYRGRRKAIKEFTHLAPDYVFWIYPSGLLFDAKNSHKLNTPKGYAHILTDEPEYGGFLRGRVSSNYGPQLIVVYCHAEALSVDKMKIQQFINGCDQIPIPILDATLVISDNGDMYGTVNDLRVRQERL